MSETEIRAAHADIMARENAWIRMINGWNSDAKTTARPVLRTVPVSTEEMDRSYEDGGFPVLLESF